ncbi:glycosyl hydrolase [Burkholderia contaminans]|nr:glycosyl hydrolase [Burkholderia contaminans]
MVAVRSLAAGGAPWLALLSQAGAHDAHNVPKAADSHATHMSMQAAPAQQKQPLATGAAFDAHHRMWGTWVEGVPIVVAHSDDAGGTLSEPVTVNAMQEPVYTSAENRPKIAQYANAELDARASARGARCGVERGHPAHRVDRAQWRMRGAQRIADGRRARQLVGAREALNGGDGARRTGRAPA